jgi:glycosyltransferase 2 family protein
LKKTVIGIIFSIIFVYLSLRGIRFEDVTKNLQDLRYIFLIPAVLLSVLIQLLRSFRWGVILSPLANINQKRLFPVTCVGFMAIALFPFRMGELVRPYLISTKSGITMTSALATVVVERVLDSMILVVIMLFVAMNSDLPGWIVKSEYIFLITLSALLFVIVFLYLKTGVVLKFLSILLRGFPKINIKLEGLIKMFVNGFKIFNTPRQFTSAVLLSVLIWIISGLIIYILFLSIGFKLPLVSAFFVLFITIAGISLPAAPGFLGNFQMGCIIALSVFSIPRSDALAFSVVYYSCGVGVNLLLGLIFLPFVDLSIKEIKELTP